MRFYLGAPEPSWLRRPETARVPLFVAHSRLSRLKTLPHRPDGWTPYAVDSGGFMQLKQHGCWTFGAAEYAAAVARYRDEIGPFTFAAIQDWMCEPEIVRRTGRTVAEHQELTLRSYLDLMDMAPDLPWMPVLQGWTRAEYMRHRDAYYAAGVELHRLPVVGIGTVCRHQAMIRPSLTVAELARDGISLHGFGFKVTGLESCAPDLALADSMAWSYNARRNPPRSGCTHASCNSCLPFALEWRQALFDKLTTIHDGLDLAA